LCAFDQGVDRNLKKGDNVEVTSQQQRCFPMARAFSNTRRGTKMKRLFSEGFGLTLLVSGEAVA